MTGLNLLRNTVRHHAKPDYVKILVVDDEAVILSFAESVLRRTGHEVVTATDGEQALRICQTLSMELDLVITDVSMPRMNGRELGKCLRGSHQHIPVILMSGYAQHSPHVIHLVNSGRLDGVPFLQKPFSQAQLLAIVSATLNSLG